MKNILVLSATDSRECQLSPLHDAFHWFHAPFSESITNWLPIVQVILVVGHPESWPQRFTMIKKEIPVVWYCENDQWLQAASNPEWIDEVIYSTMSKEQMHYTIHLAIEKRKRTFLIEEERDELVLKLKERRWIEHAKQILYEVKGLDDDAAYKFLRTQAMSERKRIIEVAKSLVTAYQMIRN